jgi:hypothetical protein
MTVSRTQPVLALPGATPIAAPSAAMDWRHIPSPTSMLCDGISARVRRIATELSGFIRASRLEGEEGLEVQILSTIADLKNLRIHVRQMKADAKAEQRAARSPS